MDLEILPISSVMGQGRIAAQGGLCATKGNPYLHGTEHHQLWGLGYIWGGGRAGDAAALCHVECDTCRREEGPA
ncbi:hypothetical protein [Cupriavidus sp. SS-3]|uniref:hypothetical protein n=1 Tax=Cupriavidus sp. SS-3 TaxID=3109596 RepID=UPI002DB6B46C|nr:hypothetical protein [Cupriavidus sp. SS-3]MEC3764997.1 hypothetical protein [Cupriavidus sp. SS-3]